MEDKHFTLIEQLIGEELPKLTKERLQNFEQLFKIYNSHTNLVSKNDEKVLFEKHIYDSLCLALFFKKFNINTSAKILDVGTGGGFPSLPLAIVFPQLQIYPLDSIAKKIGFIEFVQKELRLDNLHTMCKRAEELPQEMKGYFDVVTSRAVASLNTLLEYTVPFACSTGFVVAYKSKNADEELQNAKNAISVLKCEAVQRIKYELPQIQEHDRELIIFKKTGKTPLLYPRKSGQAKKTPL
ncbi:MAG TPA: 16S rRNA (guanine(527)-N(7))-methyltransferase RsmG [Candidatus Limenecus avicola]|jgi:16S rRNA methyltransferase gidB|uniref:Ribosomal RNA small subunit methyltransferase G n=1 Tax=Candidatus Limenecus avicola TaxID=2840847 RepID=A0A9D1SRS8_9CLOT|nr:MAG TPA: 16S rRNA (guanine(527)-N(7))-methyltransferase RsmG [Candidatus Gastranaerophilales bacterium HUM_21]HIU93010.1 16S rRNA (guanine(527)-N(7))-methyltransferase RsmG [Candidatus Limenecus avicola]